VGAEPDVTFGLHVLDQSPQRHDARAVPDDVRVHGQEEHRAFLPGHVELVDPHLQDVARVHVAVPARVEEGRVVEDPLDGQLHDPGRLAVLDELVGAIVGHERALVEKSDVAYDPQRVRTVIPRRGAIPDGAHA